MKISSISMKEMSLLILSAGVLGLLLYGVVDPPVRRNEKLIKESIARSEWARRWAERFVTEELPEELREQVIRHLAERLAERFYEAMFE